MGVFYTKMADNECNGLQSNLASGCDYFYFCDLCVQEGDSIEAFGYCMDCQDYLCMECFHTHLRPKPSRSHVLLDQHRMPKDLQQMPKDQQQMPKDPKRKPQDQQQIRGRDACTEACITHPHKTLEYFCSEHDELGCTVCMSLNHRTCKHVDHIPDIASDILNSTEYVNLQKKITALTKRTNTTIQTSRDQIKCSQTYHTNALDDLKQVTKGIRIAADKIESTVVREVDRMETEDIQRMQVLEDTCKMELENIEAMRSRFTSLKNRGQLCQMFIAMKRATQEMHSIETRVSEPWKAIEVNNYRLVTRRGAQAFLDSPETMFTLELFHKTQAKSCLTQAASSDTQCRNETNEATVLPKQHKTPAAKLQRNATVLYTHVGAIITSACVLLLAILLAGLFYQCAAPVDRSIDAWETRAGHVLDINVNSTDDNKKPYITGSVVLPGDKLVAVDWHNDKVKLINLTHNTLLSQLELPGYLWDITIVSSTQVAVTSFNRQIIYFVNASDILKLDYQVKVIGQCRGIASIYGKLVVSYHNPMKVEIISLTGEVIQTVVTEDEGRQLFTIPENVAVSRDKQTIYISDWYRHTVTRVGLTGQVHATYKSDKLKRPHGLTVDSTGTVYVSGELSNNILQLTADLTEIQQLLQQSDGVAGPESVYYCETTDLIYVGMSGSDVIKVYQLK